MQAYARIRSNVGKAHHYRIGDQYRQLCDRRRFVHRLSTDMDPRDAMLSSNQWPHMRTNHLRRREFITLLGGYLGTSSPSLERPLLDSFRQKLRDLGHVEGENLAIEY